MRGLSSPPLSPLDLLEKQKSRLDIKIRVTTQAVKAAATALQEAEAAAVEVLTTLDEAAALAPAPPVFDCDLDRFWGLTAPLDFFGEDILLL